MMPKLVVLALRRISEVTSSRLTPKISAAVTAWMSLSSWKAFTKTGSLVMWAKMRSSICE
ncbi:hypothetical protein D3C78_1995050 [compost metagenome]